MTRAEMVDRFDNKENIIAFIGCAILPLESMTKKVGFIPYNITYADYFGYKVFDDKVLYNFGYPATYQEGRCISWSGAKDSSFLTFATEFGIENCLTEIEMKQFINDNTLINEL